MEKQAGIFLFQAGSALRWIDGRPSSVTFFVEVVALSRKDPGKFLEKSARRAAPCLRHHPNTVSNTTEATAPASHQKVPPE